MCVLSIPIIDIGGDPKLSVSEATYPAHDHDRDLEIAKELQAAFDKEEEDLVFKSLTSKISDQEVLLSKEQSDVCSHKLLFMKPHHIAYCMSPE